MGGPSASLEPLLKVHEALSQSPGPPKLDHSPFSPFLVPRQASTPQFQRILLVFIASFLFSFLTPISTQKRIPKTVGRRFYPTHPTRGDFD